MEARSPVFTIGHGTRPAAELVACLRHVDVKTLIDVRRFPSSRRNPQFNGPALAMTLAAEGIDYRHEPELGGRRTGEPGEERFQCIEKPAFRSYAARMRRPEWQHALASAVADAVPCFLCAETLPWRCHRQLIAELLVARGYTVLHLLRPGEARRHRPFEDSVARDGLLYLCGELVA